LLEKKRPLGKKHPDSFAPAQWNPCRHTAICAFWFLPI
jgi:hypothetical protein